MGEHTILFISVCRWRANQKLQVETLPQKHLTLPKLWFLTQKQSWRGCRLIKSGHNCLTASVTTEEFSEIYITQTLADSSALADMECIYTAGRSLPNLEPKSGIIPAKCKSVYLFAVSAFHLGHPQFFLFIFFFKESYHLFSCLHTPRHHSSSQSFIWSWQNKI